MTRKVDTLATGEQQTRLPGRCGAVRDQEHAQPPIADLCDDFTLTAPDETQPTQTDLFRSGEISPPCRVTS
jgi:hypothetical protein